MQAHILSTFNTLLGYNMRDMILVNVPAEIEFREIELPTDSLTSEADANSPGVLLLKSKLGIDSASYKLAKTSKIPDFNTGVWYGQRQYIMPDGSKAPDMLGFTFGITLPLYSKRKQDPLIAKSEISIQQLQSELVAKQNDVELMVHHSIIDAYQDEKLILLYSSQLIPQATENLNAGITGYQENKIDFMTLIDNFLSLYNDQLQYHQTIADYYKSIAEIEMLTGRRLITQ